jgi:hypothetical protein
MWDYLKSYPDAAIRDLNRDGYDLYSEVLAEVFTDPHGLFDRLNAYHGQRLDNYIIDPWHQAWERVAMSWEWQQAERPYIQTYIDQAVHIVTWFEAHSAGDSLLTDRMLDLAFDIACQSWAPAYYDLGETAYLDKGHALIIAAENRIEDPRWKKNSTERKLGILKGSWDTHNWTGDYNDQSMYEEGVSHVRANLDPDVPDVVPVVRPIKTVDPQEAAINYLEERGIIPANVDPATPITWGEVALAIHKNNTYLYEKHLKVLYEKVEDLYEKVRILYEKVGDDE